MTAMPENGWFTYKRTDTPCVSVLLYVWNLGREKMVVCNCLTRRHERCGVLVVQLQQTGLTGSPGSHDAEHYGQVVTGLTDGFISGGHQERGATTRTRETIAVRM